MKNVVANLDKLKMFEMQQKTVHKRLSLRLGQFENIILQRRTQLKNRCLYLIYKVFLCVLQSHHQSLILYINLRVKYRNF